MSTSTREGPLHSTSGNIISTTLAKYPARFLLDAQMLLYNVQNYCVHFLTGIAGAHDGPDLTTQEYRQT